MANIKNKTTVSSEKPSPIPTSDPKQALQEAELALIKATKFNDKNLFFIQERLYKMIDYAVKRQDWYADQCHRLLQIGIGLVASGVAIIALFTNANKFSVVSEGLGWLVGFSMFTTGLILVFIFTTSLATDHPYRKVVDIKSWYFKYLFPGPLAQTLNEDPEIAKNQIDQEAKSIVNYFSNFLSLATDRLSTIREDIEQVAILLILQRYKNQQTKNMSKTLSCGLCITSIVLILLVISFFKFPVIMPIPGTLSPTNTISVTLTPTTTLTPTNPTSFSLSTTPSP